MNKKRDLGFRIEVIVMLVVFVAVIGTLTRLYAQADLESRRAAHLSDAVILTANGAEVFMAAEDDEELLRILDEANNAEKKADHLLEARYAEDCTPAAGGDFCLQIETKDSADFREVTFRVSYQGEEIYELTTGKVRGGER
ncbi:MAG: hypothetical protein IKE21_08850 [Erysipelotrichaceae bacterium]|nr:hypothetical protein [Erysipelotrichaceae bacterium]